jgi:hypothetical protein
VGNLTLRSLPFKNSQTKRRVDISWLNHLLPSPHSIVFWILYSFPPSLQVGALCWPLLVDVEGALQGAAPAPAAAGAIVRSFHALRVIALARARPRADAPPLGTGR